MSEGKKLSSPAWGAAPPSPFVPEAPKYTQERPFSERLAEHSAQRIDALSEKIAAVARAHPNLTRARVRLAGGWVARRPDDSERVVDEAAYLRLIHEDGRAIDPPLTDAEDRALQERVLAFGERLGRKWNLGQSATFYGDAGQLSLKGTVPERRGVPLRKAYLSPEIRQAPEFFERLADRLYQERISFVGAKMHTGDGYVDGRGMYAQIHNVLCFYFQDDAEFERFSQIVADVERDSRIALNRYSGDQMPKYGRMLGGALLFGVDLRDVEKKDDQYSFDQWTNFLLDAGLRRALAGGDVAAVKAAMLAELGRLRGVSAQGYLALGPESVEPEASGLPPRRLARPSWEK